MKNYFLRYLEESFTYELYEIWNTYVTKDPFYRTVVPLFTKRERLRESIEIFNAHFKQRCYFLLGDVGDDQYSYFCVKTVPYLI